MIDVSSRCKLKHTKLHQIVSIQDNSEHINSILSLIFEHNEKIEICESEEATVLISSNSDSEESMLAFDDKNQDAIQQLSDSQVSLNPHLNLSTPLLLN